jgi:hypothetical protein
MRIIDDQSRSASVHAVGDTVCLAVDTSAGNRLNTSDEKEARLDFLLLLYRIFAEYVTVRLRLTNEELVKAKRDAKRPSDEKAAPDNAKTATATRYIENF